MATRLRAKNAPSPSAPELSLRELNRATLARQMLLERAAIPVEAAVERLAGMQAQIPRPPYLGLWTRLEGFERGALSAAIRERRIVRATAYRATLHLLTAADLVAFRGALQPMLSRGMQSILRNRTENFDMEQLLGEARAFFTAKPATFDAARSHLAARFPVADERAIGYAVRTHLPLVQVPDDSPWGFPAAADFALAELWLGQAIPSGGEGLPALVRRYLAAFGPASVTDAQNWSGIGGLRATFETLRGELSTFRDARGRELFDLPGAPRPDAETPAPVRFLPEYDNLVLGHDDRSRIVADADRSRLVTRNLQVPGTFLVDGFVAGTFRVERRKKAATLSLAPFGKLLKKDLRALEAEGDLLLQFVEADAETRAVVVAPAS
ncbi:MAG: winged helix DNA-binding domain-containing protein [Thermoanaerobaculia bacterium]